MGESHIVRNSGRYPLCGRGDVNTYAVFAENMRLIVNSHGRVGCIVPSGIGSDDTTKFFFRDLMETHRLVSLYSFEDEEFIFPAVHHATNGMRSGVSCCAVSWMRPIWGPDIISPIDSAKDKLPVRRS